MPPARLPYTELRYVRGQLLRVPPAATCGELLPAVCVAIMLLASPQLKAADQPAQPLHQRIDRALVDASAGLLSPLAGDAEFLRRAYLDLIGTIPTSTEARAFLADPSTDKRTQLIDRLLDDPRYARHWANVFDVFIMERRRDKQVKADDWQNYLLASFRSNKPWDQLAREILAADGAPSGNAAAGKFYLDRDGEVDLLTRDVGRVFFGMDLQCCQCHDHPLIDTFYQSDYYGIYAFLSRGVLFADEDKQQVFAEKAEGDVTFTSVFTEEKGSTRPQLPGGFQITEPMFLHGDEYSVPPASNVRPIPKYSRRDRLAELATDGSNAPFNRNIVNRLWGYMMGRGLVTPVDLHHADNPPSHPEVLQMLADDFVAMGYDIKSFLRELALTRTYQQSAQVVELLGSSRGDSLANRLAADEAALSQLESQAARVAMRVLEANLSLAAIGEQLDAATAELSQANSVVAEALKKSLAAEKLAREAESKLSAERQLAAVLQAAADSTRQAAEKLPDDQELGAAAEKFNDRARASADAIAPLVATFEKLNAEAQQAAQQLAATRSAAESKIADHDKKAADYRQAAVPAREARQRQQSLAIQIAAAEKNLLILRQLTKQDELASELKTLAAREAEAKRQLSEASRIGSLHSSELPGLLAAHDQAQARASNLQPDLEAAQRLVEGRRSLAAAVDDAAQKAVAAVARLDDDDPLKSAAATIEDRRQRLQVELAEAEGSFAEAQAKSAEAAQQLQSSQEAIAAARQGIADAEQQTVTLTSELAALTEGISQRTRQQQAARQKWGDYAHDYGFSAPLRAMSPEQIARSVLQATGVAAGHLRAAVKAADENLPPSPTIVEDRRRFIEAQVFQKSKGQLNAFARLFGHAAGQPQADFFATVDQALYFSNSGTVQSWLTARRGNLTGRLGDLADADSIADEIYLSILTRLPSPDEKAEVSRYLADHAEDRPAAIRQMAWGLLASVEFRFIQ